MINIAKRAIKYLSAPIVYQLKNKYLFLKYRKDSDPRSIEWNWDKINYNKISILNLLIRKFTTPVYLEIGCDKNETFNSIPAVQKIGVDPKRGGTVRDFSNNFFSENQMLFDVIFIDGEHTYEQCREDIINSLKFSRIGTWIVLHDLLPADWFEHHVPRARTNVPWTGNVWKVAFELIKTKGIEFKIVSVDFGVGVILVKAKNVELFDRRQELVDKEFNWYHDNLNHLPILDWDSFQNFLDQN